MKTSRRGFLKALGFGAAGAGIATVVPMGLLGVAETRYERVSQHMLKARILMSEGLFAQMHIEADGAFQIMANEFDNLNFEDALFAVATVKYALRDWRMPIDHRRLTGFKAFHKNYGKYILSGRNSKNPISIGIDNMLRAPVDSAAKDSVTANNVLQGYYPELKGKRNIV